MPGPVAHWLSLVHGTQTFEAQTGVLGPHVLLSRQPTHWPASGLVLVLDTHDGLLDGHGPVADVPPS